MRYFNEKFEPISEEEVDLTKGHLADFRVIKEDAIAPDDITKFAYTEDDYEDAKVYFLNKVYEPTPLNVLLGV